MRKTLFFAASLCGLGAWGSRLDAQTTVMANADEAATATDASAEVAVPDQQEPKKESPWLLLPLVATNPKMGTSLGALGAWLHYFDSQSQVSMFGLMAEYSNTDSLVAGLFARTSSGADHHRAEGIVGYGYVENKYQDYLGTGQPFETSEDIRAIAARYLYRFKGNWFVGGQGVFAGG